MFVQQVCQFLAFMNFSFQFQFAGIYSCGSRLSLMSPSDAIRSSENFALGNTLLSTDLLMILVASVFCLMSLWIAIVMHTGDD
jgi:hypothetical protein